MDMPPWHMRAGATQRAWPPLGRPLHTLFSPDLVSAPVGVESGVNSANPPRVT